jgi:nucleoside-diphosphate-sugar epimerase
MKTRLIGVSSAGFAGVSPVVLMLQIAGLEVVGFDADRVYVTVDTTTNWGAVDLVKAKVKEVFEDVKMLVTCYGAVPVGSMLKNKSQLSLM